MVKHEIDHVVWYDKRGCMVLSYGDGESDRIVATKRIAAKLAQEVGLLLVPTAAGTVLWVRDPDTWRAA